MKRLLALLALPLIAACEREPIITVVTVQVEPDRVVEPRRFFVDDNLPFDLTEGANINDIPADWIELFCTLSWETRPEPVTGIQQWNPCLRADMFNDGPRVTPAPTAAVSTVDAEFLPPIESFDPTELQRLLGGGLVENPDGSFSRTDGF